jgi:histidinol-phosphate aminotransferase
MNLDRLARRTVLNIKPYVPGKPIQEVKRELGLEEVYKMASNENPLGPSPKGIEAIKQALSQLNRYPEASCYYLKNKLAEHWNLKPENFVIGNGSDELIILTLRAFLNPGEEVVVAKPTFLIYELASRIEGAEIKTVPMKNFRYDLPAMLKEVTSRTKIIFIANPDNPCGTYLRGEELDDFLNRLPEDVIVFIDEAYYEYVDHISDFPDSLKYIHSRPVIVTRTFSKIYGLAGLRVGYGMAHPEFIKYLDKVREPFNVNTLAQIAALNAIEDQDFVRKVKKLTLQGREYFSQKFAQLGLEYIESVTNFILIKVGEDADKICKFLLENGVIVRNMNGWGLKEYIRVTIGLEKENKKLIGLLSEYFKKEVEP